MAINKDRRPAVHPHWSGFLLLSKSGNSIEHEGSDSKGSYFFDGRTLKIIWEKYPSEVFYDIFGILVHERLLDKVPYANELSFIHISNGSARLTLSVEIPDTNYEVSLRIASTDIPTFEQIFINRDYDSEHLPKSVSRIVDLGANIGLSAVFFASKYPEAKILCVEPDLDNFDLLLKNTQEVRDRVNAVRCAAWIENGFINLHRESARGDSLGAWGIQVSAVESKTKVRSATLDALFFEAGFDFVDILKVDIEGAELEIFSSSCDLWLEKVKMVIVETHDRFRPGSDESVRNALRSSFQELPRHGENLLFSRRTPQKGE